MSELNNMLDIIEELQAVKKRIEPLANCSFGTQIGSNDLFANQFEICSALGPIGTIRVKLGEEPADQVNIISSFAESLGKATEFTSPMMGITAADCGITAADCGITAADCGITAADCGISHLAGQIGKATEFTSPIMGTTAADCGISHLAEQIGKASEFTSPMTSIFAKDYSSSLFAEQIGKVIETINQIEMIPERETIIPNIDSAPVEAIRANRDYRIKRNHEGDINYDSGDAPYLEVSKVLKRITSINDAAKVTRGIEIFKPTNRTHDSFIDMLLIKPNDKESFGQIIDKLYIIFYESAGDSKLRFLKENGGVLTKSDCEFIWCLKHLRNKWLRHDPDHGKDSDIKGNWKKLRKAFDWLGISRFPTEQEEFRYMYSKLINEAQKFLDLLQDQIKGLKNT